MTYCSLPSATLEAFSNHNATAVKEIRKTRNILVPKKKKTELKIFLTDAQFFEIFLAAKVTVVSMLRNLSWFLV
jgi:hypothetical protein